MDRLFKKILIKLIIIFIILLGSGEHNNNYKLNKVVLTLKLGLHLFFKMSKHIAPV